MADKRFICVLDLETSSLDIQTTQILEIASVIINPYSLKIVDEFRSLVQPDDFNTIEQKALDINNITKEELEEAPAVEVVFPIWVGWIDKYNIAKKKNNSWGAPIPCGANIRNFDLPILDRYFERFAYWDDKWNNRTPLNPVFIFDIMDHLWLLFRTNQDINNIKLTTILEYMGVPKEEIEDGAHGALWDAQQSAKIAIKLLNLAKYLTEFTEGGKRRLEMKGCLK